MLSPQEVRDRNLAFLNQHGFRPATWMPLPSTVGSLSLEDGEPGGTVRPAAEIADRLMCHCAVFAWGSAPQEFERDIANFIGINSLREKMTQADLEIVNLPKEEATSQFADVVGWRLENMWSLAWILGLAKAPSATTGQLSEDVIDTLLSHFMPDFKITSAQLLSAGQPQPPESVIAMEDLFYLAHNAVRSGQIGDSEQLPAHFHPIRDGGAIHERRHSLTWSLTPGSSWDETDLST